MRIEFQRSGGIAGAILRSEVETEDLPEDESRQFEEILSGLDLTSISTRARRAASGPAGGADRFQFDLVVVQGGQRDHLTFSDADAPVELRPLLDKMQALARKR